MMHIDKKGHIYCKCDICGKETRFGPDLYEGRVLQLYGQAFCCKICWDGNWDGWGPIAELAILHILKEKNLPIPERNEKGWLPRD
ncbi:hypothetical protein ACQ8E4_001395 [Escherichia coli]|uniref:hypothetical protein n=1 Tax=Escherichia coli TaxID=562 RepID=UPI0018E17D30|nr:hypothetical protein [Escherichia coli]MEC9951292.1 hypothetical protein [Escherichia marmotae]MBI0800738.1 hypothetical protein [Escherichia coli]MED8755604.1 hypothetical protein [Escherichia marmotae]MED9696510.1 hypothetical protein [Escherichia marmotae]HAY4354642.1 hypothetical protein [Escherichia coli]